MTGGQMTNEIIGGSNARPSGSLDPWAHGMGFSEIAKQMEGHSDFLWNDPNLQRRSTGNSRNSNRAQTFRGNGSTTSNRNANSRGNNRLDPGRLSFNLNDIMRMQIQQQQIHEMQQQNNQKHKTLAIPHPKILEFPYQFIIWPPQWARNSMELV